MGVAVIPRAHDAASSHARGSAILLVCRGSAPICHVPGFMFGVAFESKAVSQFLDELGKRTAFRYAFRPRRIVKARPRQVRAAADPPAGPAAKDPDPRGRPLKEPRGLKGL